MLGMKPRFALDLTNDAISLLERAGDAWVRIGQVDLSDPALDSKLNGLRQLAEARAPEGFVSKLILPNSQILYLEVTAPGPDRPSRRAQISAALEGRTPYPVGELVFDWSRNGRMAKVAVLAKVTLDEAENFADAYGFRPAGFVAIPENGYFSGEPFFGLTSVAAKHLPQGMRLDRDQDPVWVVKAAAPPSAPLPALTPEPGDRLQKPAPEQAEPVNGGGGDAKPASRQTTAEIGADVKEGAETPPHDLPTPETSAPAMPSSLPNGTQEIRLPDEAPFVEVEDVGGADQPDDPAGAGMQSAQVTAFAVDEGAPQGRTEAFTGPSAVGPNLTIGALPDLDTDQGAKPSVGGFQSRRAPGPTGNEGAMIAEVTRRIGGFGSAQTGVRPQATPPRAGAASESGRQPGVQSGHGKSGQVSAPVARVGSAFAKAGAAGLAFGQAALSAGRAQVTELGKARQGGNHAPAANAPTRTVFGAVPKAALAVTTMPLGMLMALALILVIAAIALWSIWFTTASENAVIDGTTSTAVAPMVAPETAATAASASPSALAAKPQPTPKPEATAPDLPTPSLVTVAPVATPAAEVDSASDALVSGTESAPPLPTNFSLPAIKTLTSDASISPQALPQPFGTLLRYDANGLITPTPEGVVTPGGFTLFAAKPPRLPPARPATLRPTAVAPEAAAPNPLEGKTPRARPAGLVPPVQPGLDHTAVPVEALPMTQTADLGPPAAPVDPRHAAKKPQSRPASVGAAAAAARQNAEAVADAAASAARAEAEAAQAALSGATKQAVASSRRPGLRPDGFAKTVAAATPPAAAAPPPPEVASIDAADVDAALAEALVAAEPAAPVVDTQAASQDVDEPEVVDGVPNMATTKTVAKKSTFANAIDLGDINLIGVYGSSANRRALVRMPNGRFVKVQVGDRLDGGKVAAIGDSELSYVKKGKTHILKLLDKT